TSSVDRALRTAGRLSVIQPTPSLASNVTGDSVIGSFPRRSRGCTITAYPVKVKPPGRKGAAMSAITRRRFAAGALAASAAPVLARAARAQTAVKIGTAVLGDYSMAGPVIVALERGFFTSEGLAVEFVPFRGGPDLLKAVMVGECLVGISGSTDILVFREAGSPIKMIATHTDGNHFTLNVAPDVQRVGDLKGKAIGVTRVGATTWVFARMLARKEGWDPDRDVQIVGLGGLDAQLAALARREIAAYVWGDGGAVTELQGKSKVLLRLDAVTPKWISQIQYASEDAIRRLADPIRKSQRALFRAIKLMRETTKEAAEVVAKKLGWTPEAGLAAQQISGPLLPVAGHIDVEALSVMQSTLLEHGLLKKKLPLDEHYTREFTPVRVSHRWRVAPVGCARSSRCRPCSRRCRTTRSRRSSSRASPSPTSRSARSSCERT